MTALRRAMRCTPRDRATVITAGSPSGIAEAANATTSVNISAGLSPRHTTPSTKVTADARRMTAASHRPKRPICSSNGVAARSTPDSRVLMRPSSVSEPVAITTPSPWPKTATVPVKHVDLRSPSSVSASTGSGVLATGTDSPVRAASSMRSSRELRIRRSAGTRSPEARRTTSPGTRSAAGMSTIRPSRWTRVRGASMARIESSADAARPSWTKPMSAFTITRPSGLPCLSSGPGMR